MYMCNEHSLYVSQIRIMGMVQGETKFTMYLKQILRQVHTRMQQVCVENNLKIGEIKL